MSARLAYLRADASRSLGLGHLSRAVAMGKTLQRNGIEATVLSRRLENDPRFITWKFQDSDGMIHYVKNEDEFISVLDAAPGAYLFIDLLESALYAPLIPQLQKRLPSYRSICFDAFFDSELPFDLFVRPLFDESSEGVRALTGLKYYVFDEELRKLAPKKEASTGVRCALITLGGSDPLRATKPIAQALCETFPQIRFTAVVGPNFLSTERQELLNLSDRLSNLECAIEPRFLGELYMAHDVAITSGGLTKFETALFGIPSLIVANSPQEEKLSKEFAHGGGSVFLGRADQLDTIRLKMEFERMLAHPEWLKDMSQKSRNMLDIHGGERILEYIKQNLS